MICCSISAFVRNNLCCFSNRKTDLLIFPFIVMTYFGCTQKNGGTDPHQREKLEIADSLMVAGRSDSAEKMLTAIRRSIKPEDPCIVNYYAMLAQINAQDTLRMNLYADSATAFFKTPSQTKEYLKEYYQALLTKGEASVSSKKYITALNYYYRCRKVLANGVCDNGDLAGKMGFIYYSQKNYKLAARYWAESCARLENCKGYLNAQKTFFYKQGALDNAGYSYYLAGSLDSARKYYLEDIKLVEQAKKGKVIEQQYVTGAMSVVYDNYAGLNLRLGNLPVAEQYLLKCLDLNKTYRDGVRIPPLLKLAEIYLKQDNLGKAATAFTEARQLLDKFEKANPESLVKYYKIYAQYLFKINDPGPGI